MVINGHDIVQDQSAAKARLSFVPEVPSLYELLTVEEHLKFVAMCYGRLDLFEMLRNELLEKYDLAEKRNELVATLSKGMRQKLSVACALVHDANVMLFDEALIGVDPAGAHEFKLELLKQKQNGAAILISTHLLDSAERLCDRVVIVARGKKITEGTMAELQAQSSLEGHSLEDVFLKLTEEQHEAPAVPHH